MASAMVVLLTLFTLLLVQKADIYLKIYKRRAHMLIYVKVVPGIITRLEESFTDMGLQVGDYSVSKHTPEQDQMLIEAQLFDTGGKDRSQVAAGLMELEHVLGVDFF